VPVVGRLVFTTGRSESVNNKTVAKVLRWIGRIIALPVMIFFLVFGLGYFIDTLTTEGLHNAIGGVDDLLGAIITLLALVGVIISWWWLLPAGILLIFAYLLGGLNSGMSAAHHVGFYNWSQFRDFWTVPGIMYLIAGILFIISCWFSKRTTSSDCK
jgi:hypothetical protein